MSCSPGYEKKKKKENTHLQVLHQVHKKINFPESLMGSCLLNSTTEKESIVPAGPPQTQTNDNVKTRADSLTPAATCDSHVQ